MKHIITLVILLYLLYQSINDLKEMEVYTLPNNLCLLFSILSFFLLGNKITIYTIFIPLALIIIHIVFHAYGSGDIKAFISVFLIVGPLPFFLFLFLTSIIFLIFIPKKEGRGPLFPAMFISYLIISILF